MVFFEVALRILEPLVRAWRRTRPMSPLRALVRDATRNGKALLREIQLAESDDPRALSRLTDRVIQWWGDFEVALSEADLMVYERFTSPLLDKAGTTADLSRSVEEKLAMLR